MTTEPLPFEPLPVRWLDDEPVGRRRPSPIRAS